MFQSLPREPLCCADSHPLRISPEKVFDTIDKDGSGYVDEREWRRLTQDTPLAASDETLLFVERVRRRYNFSLSLFRVILR